MQILEKEDIAKLVAYLRQDDVVAVPTDTVFGVCARYDHQKAQENLRNLKKRPQTKAFPLMCADLAQVKTICEISKVEENVIKKLMPGPLTLILKKKLSLPYFVNGGMETVAIRLATDDNLKMIIQQLGCPIYMTSANLSGEPSALSVEDVKKAVPNVKAILNGKVAFAKASTIAEYHDQQWQILRNGPITLNDLEKNN